MTGITYAPDGDVLGASDSVNGQWAYQYGPLNRLTLACSPDCSSPATELQYVYDRFGNRWQENVLAGSGQKNSRREYRQEWPQLTFDANNHIVGGSYDASGDLLGEGSQTFTFDAEGRISSADSGNVQYVYDAFGDRVEKITPAGTFYYLHDLAGRPITELTPSGGFNRGEIFANGKHLATYANATTYFDYSDWLGTLRMQATVAGYEQTICTSLPYGGDWNCAGGFTTPMQFTGQVHDTTTGLDHFPARYYADTLGRWITPDWSPSPTAVPYASFADPQSLGLYVYLMDNPVSGTDPTGHSHLVYDGSAHVIYLVAHSGAVIGKWPAYNNVAIRNNDTRDLTAGPLADGRYPVSSHDPDDQHGAKMHLGDSPSGPFGPGGIIHIVSHKGILGEVVVGAGVHGGRAKRGATYLTNGCVRTCNPGMLEMNGWLHRHPGDPLHYVQVKNNQQDILNWLTQAEKSCAGNPMGCDRLRPPAFEPPVGGSH